MKAALGLFALVFVGTFALGQLGRVIPFVGENLLGFLAILFLYLPLWALGRSGEDPAAYGITTRGWGRGLLSALAVTLLMVPLFALGYHAYHGLLLGQPPDFRAVRLARWSEPLEGRPRAALDGPHLHLWIEGARGVATMGRGYEGPDVPLTVTDAPVCTLTPGARCAFATPSDGALRVRTDDVDAVFHLGRYGVRRAAPFETTHGFSWWWTFLIMQLGLVALPEEALYRGYLQPKLDQRYRPRWRFLGAPIGPGLFITSALFAMGHMAIEPGVHRLAVFFPSLLFGWLRARTGSIVAPIVVHAAANLLIRAVALFYYGP